MAWRLFGARPLPEPMLAYCHLDSWEQISVKFESEFYHFYSRKCIWNCRLPKWRPFCPDGDKLKWKKKKKKKTACVITCVQCSTFEGCMPCFLWCFSIYRSLTHWGQDKLHGRHFPDDIFTRIFFNENVWISIKISLKFVPKGPINNIPSLVQIMAWRRPGDKPLFEPMMVRWPTHIWVTRPQWVKHLRT